MTTAKFFTLGEASKQTGIQKSTLSKALKSGKLSYVDKTSAGYKIDPAELFRVFPKKPLEAVSSERLDTPQETHEINELKAKLHAQDKLMQRLESENKDLKADRDEWREQARSLRLLTDQRSKSRGFWSWFKS